MGCSRIHLTRTIFRASDSAPVSAAIGEIGRVIRNIYWTFTAMKGWDCCHVNLIRMACLGTDGGVLPRSCGFACMCRLLLLVCPGFQTLDVFPLTSYMYCSMALYVFIPLLFSHVSLYDYFELLETRVRPYLCIPYATSVR